MVARRLAPWIALGSFVLGVAASCSGSDGKKREASSGGQADAGGAGATANVAGGPTAGVAGSLATAGGTGAPVGGGATEGGAGGSPALVSNSGQGGVGLAEVESGGASGVGGAAGQGSQCCDAGDYHASSNQFPQDVCSAWVPVDTADPEEPALNAGLLRVSTSTNAENQYYGVYAPNLGWPAKFVAEARMQLISGSASVASRAPAFVGFVLGPNHQKNLLQIANGEIFLLSAENTKAASAAVATTDALHVYRVEVDTALGTVEVFYDGQSKLTGATFTDPNGGSQYVNFGEGSTFATGTSDWAYVTHNAYVCAP
jgi:hypothetical protein